MIFRPGSEKRRRAQEGGQALVETALTLPLLIMMLLGAVELGRLAYVAIEVTNTAKAAVQYGAQNSGTADDPGTMETVAKAEATDYGITLNSFSVDRPCTCVKAGTASASTCTDMTCASSGGYLLQTLSVTTSAQFSPVFKIPGLPTSYNVYGKAVQEVLR